MKKARKFLCMLSAAAAAVMTVMPVNAEPELLGDADGNGTVNIYDVIRIAKYMLKPEETTVSEGADCNGDGKIDLYDAIRAAEMVLKNSASENKAVAGAVSYIVTKDNIDMPELEKESYFSCADYYPSGSDTVYRNVFGTYVSADKIGEMYSAGKLSGDFYNKADKQKVIYEESCVCCSIKGIGEDSALAVKSLKSSEYALYISSGLMSGSKPETIGEMIEAFSLKSEAEVREAYSLTEISSDENKPEYIYEKTAYDIDNEFLWNVLLADTEVRRVSDGFKLTEEGGRESIGHNDLLISLKVDFLSGCPEKYSGARCLGLNLNGYISICIEPCQTEWFYIGKERAEEIMDILKNNYKCVTETVKTDEPDCHYYAEPEPYSEPDIRSPYELPQLGDLEKLLTVKYGGKNYSRWYYNSCSVPEYKIGERLTDGTLYGSDCIYSSVPQHKCGTECKAPDRNGAYYNEKPAVDYKVKGDAYRIKGISENYMIAVKSADDPLYVIYINRSYNSDTLGDLINDLNLREEMTVNDTVEEYRFLEFADKEYDCSCIRKECGTCDIDEAFVWDVLLADTGAEAVTPANVGYGNTNKGNTIPEFSISVGYDIMGLTDNIIGINRNGYIWTNIGLEGRAFFIGEEKAKQVINHAFKNYPHTFEITDYPDR